MVSCASTPLQPPYLRRFPYADHSVWPSFSAGISSCLSQLTELKELSLRHFRWARGCSSSWAVRLAGAIAWRAGGMQCIWKMTQD